MSLPTRVRVYLSAILLGTYMVHTSLLIDQFHISRFVFVSLLNLFALLWIVPTIKNIRLHLFDALVFAFYALHLFSISWSFNFAEAIFTAQKGLLLFLSYFIFRLILEKFKEAEIWITLMILATSLFVLLITSIQLYQVLMDTGIDGDNIYQLIGWAGHKNLVASYIFLLFCYLIAKASYVKYKGLLFFTLAWQLIIILVFRSRAVYLGLAVFLLIGGTYYLWTNTKYRKSLFNKILPALFILGTGGAFIASTTTIGQHYLTYLNPATYSQSASANERLFVWYKTRVLIKDNPILGCGSGNWKVLFPSKGIEGGYRLQQKDVVFTRVHNDFLEVWAEVGSLGLLLYLLLFLAPIGMLVFYLQNKEKNTEQLWLTATLLGYMVIAFFDFPKERIEHQVFLALILAASIVGRKQVWQKKWPSVLLSKNRKTILIGFLFLCWLPNIPVGYARLLGDYYTKNLFIAKDQKDSKKLYTVCNKIPIYWYSIDPLTLPIKWYEGLGYYFEKDYESAESRFADAYHTNPYNFHVLNNYASTLVQVKKYRDAIPILEEAIAINGKFEIGLFNLSFAHFNLGEYEKALEWVNKTTRDPKKKALFIKEIKRKQQEEQ